VSTSACYRPDECYSIMNMKNVSLIFNESRRPVNSQMIEVQLCLKLRRDLDCKAGIV
jgi:hypothetical protein